MIRHSAGLIRVARDLALKQHISYREIGRRLNVSDSTIGVWLRAGPGSPEVKKSVWPYQTRREKTLSSENVIFKNLAIDRKLAKIFCGIIYGCEGSKYPASNCVALANSDPDLIASFTKLLRLAYHLDESKWRVRLQIHSNQNFAKLASFWSKITKIPVSKFYKPTVTVASESKHRRNYLGTCTVKYYNYKLQLKLIGIFNEFMRKSSLLEDDPDGKGTIR